MSTNNLKLCSSHGYPVPLTSFSDGQLTRRGAKCLECLRKRNLEPKEKWFGTRSTAKRRGLSFTLTLEEFSTVVSRPCIYGGGKTRIGIDRIDNSEGYDFKNCAPCCYKHNLIRGKWFSFDDMLKLVALFPEIKKCGDRPCRL